MCNLVRTSHETHYVSATKTNRLILFDETVPVYCKKHVEHSKYILCREHCVSSEVV
jgi:hypothetical protein